MLDIKHLFLLCPREVRGRACCLGYTLLGRWHSHSSPQGRGHPFCPLPGPEDSCEAYRHVLGQDKLAYEVPHFHGDEEHFFVEGLSFPDAGFSGLISFHVTLLDDSNEVGWAGQRGREKTSIPGRDGHCWHGRFQTFLVPLETLEQAAHSSPWWSSNTPGLWTLGSFPSALPLQDFSESPIFTDTVVFRVAPWIMTPSTLPPLEVYVCR